VNVLGQVYNPTAIVYQADMKVRDYLQRAGGTTEGADEKHIFVIKASGSIMTEQSYRDMMKSQIFPLLPLVSGGMMDGYLEPGDTLFVPEEIITITGLQYTKEISQVVANVATGIAMTALLGTQL
jgi:protein involved in polysaccharide export with SLBB domain